ncbi:MAG TPA: tRNA lysidine(34) synthetase TilS [Dongiaceae bacterium]|nr:tRNA lysidine(34) synthetase TilS [Dongiaceae bacterium]
MLRMRGLLRYALTAMPKRKQTKKRDNKKRSELAMQLLQELRGRVHAGHRIGVAVSGGADSVALLHLLLEIREQLGIVLFVIHFNHQLRGKASRGDEAFVRRLASQSGVPSFVHSEDVASRSKRERANLEDTARRARYAYFSRIAQQERLDRIAVAHTAEDQAETVLAHILRGTGLAGLGGIHPESGVVFRPMLGFRRADLRKYLRERRQLWREDATNRDTKRMRARIRHKLLPLLEKTFSPAAVEHLCQLARFARVDNEYLESGASTRVSARARKTPQGTQIKIGDLLGPHRKSEEIADESASARAQNRYAMASRMVRLLIESVRPRGGQISTVHVDAILALAEDTDSGKCVQVPGGVEVRREREWLVFRAVSESRESTANNYAIPVELSPGTATVAPGEHSYKLEFRVIDWPAQGRETNVTGAVLDLKVLGVPLVVRNWQPGDSVQLLGHQKRHKLSRLLNEVGVSRWEKVSWPVLTSGGRVAWIRSLGVAAEFAASNSTRKGVFIEEVPVK